MSNVDVCILKMLQRYTVGALRDYIFEDDILCLCLQFKALSCSGTSESLFPLSGKVCAADVRVMKLNSFTRADRKKPER